MWVARALLSKGPLHNGRLMVFSVWRLGGIRSTQTENVGKTVSNWAEQNTSARKCRRLAIPRYPEQHGQGESGNTLQPDRGALPDQAIDPFRL